ncbi:alpha/beta-hydrolase [Wallemia mellicola]|nr:alpha/beta-hydrolase [Wallemia mellicola]
MIRIEDSISGINIQKTWLMTQPIKYLYIFGVCLSIVLLAPLWAILDYPLSNRPSPDWPLSRCIRIRAFRMIEPTIPLCAFDRDLGRLPTHMPIVALLRRSKFNWIPPLSGKWLNEWLSNLIDSVEKLRITNEEEVGVLNARWLMDYTPKLESCRPTQIPGYMYFDERVLPLTARDAGYPVGNDERVMLQFHGGGYVVGSAHETDSTAPLCKDFIKYNAVQRIYSVDYRLAWYAPFPAALVDALSAWAHLVEDLDIPASQIIVSGDSAGANLALALTTYLRDNGFALPAGLALHSPWTDMTFSRRSEQSFNENSKTDILEKTLAPYAVKMLTRYVGVDMIHSPYLSPLSRENCKRSETFKGFPQCFVIAGECEMLLDECRDLHLYLVKAGVRSSFHIVKRGVHDPAMFDSWQEPERSEMFLSLASWIDGLFRTTKDYGLDEEV